MYKIQIDIVLVVLVHFCYAITMNRNKFWGYSNSFNKVLQYNKFIIFDSIQLWADTDKYVNRAHSLNKLYLL